MAGADSQTSRTQRLHRERDFDHFFEPFQSLYSGQSHLPAASPSSLVPFAQLVALRLNAKHAFISLLGRETQYVLAEATRSPSDSFLMGTVAIPASAGLCHNCVFPRKPADCIIHDLRHDPRLDLPNLHPSIRDFVFFAGAPILSPSGFAIGALCILDDSCRPEFNDSHLQVLRDLTTVISSTLSDARTRLDHSRSVRMIHGITALVEGKTSIRAELSDFDESSQLATDSFEGRINQKRHEDDSQVHILSSEIRRLKTLAQDGFDQKKSDNASRRVADFEASLPPASPDLSRSADRPPTRESDRTPGVDALFARASNIVREALGVEGVVFLTSDTLQSSISHDQDRFSDSDHAQGDSTPGTKHSPSDVCKVLAFSTTTASSVNGDGAENALGVLPSRVLLQLLHRYPRGKHFRLSRDADFSSSSGPDEVADPLSSPGEEDDNPLLDRSNGANEDTRTKIKRRLRLRQRKHDLAGTLFSNLERAKSMLFQPLWDSHTQRWCGAMLVWTQQQTRTFSPADLTFLGAFGTNTMAEFTHLNNLATERLKYDFVSTVSHELRSPLHGLLGSTEVLQDTFLNVFQSDMVLSIKACGTTLLDTINSILDFARITQSQDSHHAKSSALSRKRSTGKLSPSVADESVDLAEVTENVIHSSVSGYEASSYTANRSANSVSVIVDIEPAPSWRFRIPHGSWTRIVLNLVTNCLKYTPKGFIHVHMSAVPLPAREETSLRKIVLTVTDTGIGMSDNFAKNQLYRSFTQEDPQSAGTGLGLSIVHQLVGSMGGHISVDTKRGEGTQFRVEVSAALEDGDGTGAEARADLYQTGLNYSQGLRVAFLGFPGPADSSTTVPAEEVSCSSLSKNGAALEMQSLRRICEEWYNMDVIDSTKDDVIPDVVLLNAISGTRMVVPPHKASVATVSLCDGLRSAFAASTQSHAGRHVLARPIGARKFARALATWMNPGETPASPTSSVDTEMVRWRHFSPESEPAESEAAESEAEPEHQAASHERLVLAVDDNPLNLKLLQTVLKRLKIRSISATNGAEAVQRFSENRHLISHILMDMSMPVMDGFEATRQIRQMERSAKTSRPAAQIIALTGLASTQAQEEAKASGIDMYLTKPVRLDSLRVIL